MKTQIIQQAAAGIIGAFLCINASSKISAADAPLTAGNPVTIGTPMTFSGVSGGSITALQAFETAIGGSNNGANPPPQPNGFRTINWDGVALDGTDFGGISTVIDVNHVVGIPLHRFQERGVFFDEIYAVSGPASVNDSSTFSTVNPNVSTLFPAFSPTKTFAMFNDNGIGLRFVLASAHTSSPKFVATRGFGAIFRNVALPSTTSIEYFNDARSLGKFFVPSGSSGQAEFLGVLFDNPIVTSVQITCGTDVLFSFDGVTFTSGGADNPAGGHNLVVTDDFAYAEPTKATNAQPDIAATAGSPFNGVVATFSDLDPSGNAKNFTATIDWGDGHQSTGLVSANANGGFDVTGGNLYASGGTLPVTVRIADFEGSKLEIHNSAVVAGPGLLLNTSARARVLTGGDVLIGGFILGGNAPSHILVRVLGPSLTSFGVSGALQDPDLELHDGSGTTIAFNEDWKDTQQAQIQATGLAPSDDRESAILATLPPGNYTAIVRGKGGTTGVGLVEIYNLP